MAFLAVHYLRLLFSLSIWISGVFSFRFQIDESFLHRFVSLSSTGHPSRANPYPVLENVVSGDEVEPFDLVISQIHFYYLPTVGAETQIF